MKTVWKFDVPPLGVSIGHEIPAGAQFLGMEIQNALGPVMWFLVEPDTGKPMELRTFTTYGTGRPIDPGSEYRGTWQEGPFVWHVFERVG